MTASTSFFRNVLDKIHMDPLRIDFAPVPVEMRIRSGDIYENAFVSSIFPM